MAGTANGYDHSIMSTSAKLQFRNVSFSYSNEQELFSAFSWQVFSGQSWAVLGPSGCGKTTLLTLAAGLEFPQQGEIRVAGRPLERPRPGTGLILQDYGLLPWATVQENAGLGLRIRRFYGPDGTHAPLHEVPQGDISRWLERLDIAALADQYPAQISGGERQRTAIARTLALNPDLLLMDEPFASLDAPTRRSLQELVLELKAEHELTLVTVTHTLEEAAVLGEKILLLGHPPHRELTVIDNPRGGKLGFRGSSAYYRFCARISGEMDREVKG